MTDDRRSALDAVLASLEAACQVIEEPWGVFVANPEFHRIHMGNFLWLRALPPAGIDGALARLDDIFAPLRIPQRQLFFEDSALAERVTPELERRGFRRKAEHLMFARRPATLTANPEVALRPARDAATWDDHDAVAGLLHEEEGYDHEVSYQLLGLHRRRQAELGSEVYVAYVDGRPIGNVAILAMRARAGERDLSPFFLRTTVGHSTWQMYEKLGFVREGTLEGFLRETPVSRESTRESSPR